MHGVPVARLALTLAVLSGRLVAQSEPVPPVDPTSPGARLALLQISAVDGRDVERERLYHYGHQAMPGAFSNHRTHSNRPVPVFAYGPYGDLRGFVGRSSAYRDAERLESIYGRVPPRTVDPKSVHGDQTDLYRLLLSAADRGARRLIVLLMDGGDWQTYAAASVVKSGHHDVAGYEHDLAFCGAGAPGWPLSVGAVVTSPLRGAGVPPGFDAGRGGRFPWSPQDALYLAGDLRMDSAAPAGPVRSELHAVVDSAASATAIFSGKKVLNGRVNAAFDGSAIEPLGRSLQRRGFAVGTVTDVPFNHASPAAVYASSPSRSRYHDIGRQMLGLGAWPGVDVALGYGFGYGEHTYLAAEDLQAVRSDDELAVVTPRLGEDGSAMLASAAEGVAAARAAGRREESGLFGYFGSELYDHAPYRTADGRYDPTQSLEYSSGAVAGPEVYSPAVRSSSPDLQTMTRAALEVLSAVPERPYLLLVEAGLVDWSHHANNLDHAVGEVFSAEATFELLVEWLAERGELDQTLLVVTSDHGHLLQVDFAGLAAQLHRR